MCYVCAVGVCFLSILCTTNIHCQLNEATSCSCVEGDIIHKVAKLLKREVAMSETEKAIRQERVIDSNVSKELTG